MLALGRSSGDGRRVHDVVAAGECGTEVWQGLVKIWPPLNGGTEPCPSRCREGGFHKQPVERRARLI